MINVDEIQCHFTMTDGFNLFYRCWRTSAETERVVICIHGVGNQSGWFKVIGPKLAEDGSQVYALDLRGFGNSQEEGLPRGDTRNFKRHLQDLDDAVSCIQRDHNGKKIFGFGYSLGCSYFLWYIANHPYALDGLVLAGGSSVVKALHTRGISIKLFLANLFAPRLMYNLYNSSFAEGRDSEEVRFILQNPLEASKLSIRYIANIKKILFDRILENASKIQKPTLMLQGGADDVALPEGVVPLYENLGTDDRSIQIFPEAGHWFYDTFSPAMPREESDPTKREHLFSIVKDWLRIH